MRGGRVFKVLFDGESFKPLEPVEGLERGKEYIALFFVSDTEALADLEESKGELRESFADVNEFPLVKLRGVLPDEGDELEDLERYAIVKRISY